MAALQRLVKRAMEAPPARFNLARHCLVENVRRRPDKIALVVARGEASERAYAFSAFEDTALRIAGGLRACAPAPGARIVLRLEASDDFALAFMAAVAAGFVAVPSAAQLTAPELEFLIEDCAAALLIADGLPPGFACPGTCRVVDAAGLAALKGGPRGDYADTAAEDPAFLVYTSGTTARPKGVLHAQRNVWGRRPMIAGWTGLGPSDVMLHAGRLNWTYTLGVGLMDPWTVGAGAVLYDGPKDPCVYPRLIERYKCTIFSAVPTLYRQILKHCDISWRKLPSLRHGLTAGEPLSPALLEEWRRASGRELYEALGMSEISTYISSGPATPSVPGSPGRPQPGRRVAVLAIEGGQDPLPAGETGLIAVHRSDPALMLGYWRRPEEEALSRRGEWFVGGDLGAFDEAGYLWFKGRNNELMKALGYRVSPLEVERALSQHPLIAEAAAAERKVGADISVIAAYVVLRRPGALAAEDVIAWCEGRLADYKRPREVFFLDALPRTANGKIRRAALSAPCGGQELANC